MNLGYLDEFSALKEVLGDENLMFFSNTVNNRLHISEWFCGQIPSNYRGGFKNDGLVNAFLFSLKSALDCMSETVNRFYGLDVDPNRAWSVATLQGNVSALDQYNPELSAFIRDEFEKDTHDWYKEFSQFRNQATHGVRISLLMRLELPGDNSRAHLKKCDGSSHPLEIHEYCKLVLERANTATEECYRLVLGGI